MNDINELRNDAKTAHCGHLPLEVSGSEVLDQLLDRLEAAEKERDALRAKIEQMEKQEPIGWFARIDGDGPLMECKHADLPRVPLYARVGAQAAPEAKV